MSYSKHLILVPEATEFNPAKLDAEHDAVVESLEKKNYNKVQPKA